MTEPRPGEDRQGALRDAVRGDEASVGGLVAAMGGALGIVESVLPSVVFLVVQQITHALLPSLVAPLVLAVLFVLVRLVRRSRVVPAIAGALAVALSALLAALTGDPKTFFGPGIVLNAVYFVAFASSVVARVPILGVAAAFLLGDQRSWRADAAKRRVFTRLTLLWTAMFGVRVAVEVPLLISGTTAGLGIARILLGVPLYAPVLVLSLLAVQAVYRGGRDPAVS